MFNKKRLCFRRSAGSGKYDEPLIGAGFTIFGTILSILRILQPLPWDAYWWTVDNICSTQSSKWSWVHPWMSTASILQLAKMVITSSVPSAFSFSRVTSAKSWAFWGSYIVFWCISSSMAPLLVTNSVCKSTSISMGIISYVLTAPSKVVSGCIEVRISRLTFHAGRQCSFRICAAYARSFWNTFMS